jgi:hypothetical protein
MEDTSDEGKWMHAVSLELDGTTLELHSRPRLLVVDADEKSAALLSAELNQRIGPLPVSTATPSAEPDIDEAVDVCLVHLSDGGTQELAFVAAQAGNSAETDCTIVFWAETPNGPQARAARALGLSQIVPAGCLVAWLAKALPALALKARATRMMRRAQRMLPPIPAWSECREQESPLALARAEMLFRESYIRRVLAETGSRRKAAQAAGVPYRTFCDIIKKLDIR